MSSVWTIRRSATDAKLTGLCGGIAQHWGIDPVVVRVAAALLALSGGIGVMLYVAGWLLIPVEGKQSAPIDDWFGPKGRPWTREVWIAIVVLACIITFSALGSVTPFGFGPALVVAAIWYFGFYRKQQRAPKTPASQKTSGQQHQQQMPPAPQPHQFYPQQGPRTAFTDAADAWRRRVEENDRIVAERARQSTPTGPVPHPGYATPSPYGAAQPTPYSPASSRTQPATWPTMPTASPVPASAQPDPVPDEAHERAAFLAAADPIGLYSPAAPSSAAVSAVRVDRRRSLSARRLRMVTLIVLGLVLGGLKALGLAGVAIPVAGYFAAALLVLGLALIAATWFGRARGLLPVSLVVLVATAVASFAGPLAQVENWSSTRTTYTALSELPTSPVIHDVGAHTVDLSSVPVTRDATYTAHVSWGALMVKVPSDVNVRVQYAVDNGAVKLYTEEIAAGSDLRRTVEPDPVIPGAPTLTLVLSVDQGKIEVQR